MNHEPTFLSLIQDNLDDDAPRLVYADWLQQKGSRYGKFIAASCALEPHLRKHGCSVIQLRPLRIESRSDPEVERLRSYVRRLLKKNRAAWEAELRPLTDAIEWSRGFVEGLTIRVSEIGSPLLVSAPCLVALTVVLDEPAELQAVLDAAIFPRLRRLFLRGALAAAADARLRLEPRPGTIKALGLSTTDGWTPTVQQLLELHAFDELEELAIDAFVTPGARAHAETLALLAGVQGPLVRLDVRRMQLGSTGYAALFDRPWFSELEVLAALDTALDDETGAALVRRLPRARALDLSGNGLREGTARALLEHGGGIEHLDLRGNFFAEESRRALSAVYGDRVAL